METLGIDGAWVFTPRIHPDDRGSFLEWLRGQRARRRPGLPPGRSPSQLVGLRRGVVRGIHFADVPPGQAKYVTCVRGAVQDVVVDMRVNSPTFGRWEAIQLDDRTGGPYT